MNMRMLPLMVFAVILTGVSAVSADETFVLLKPGESKEMSSEAVSIQTNSGVDIEGYRGGVTSSAMIEIKKWSHGQWLYKIFNVPKGKVIGSESRVKIDTGKYKPVDFTTKWKLIEISEREVLIKQDPIDILDSAGNVIGQKERESLKTVQKYIVVEQVKTGEKKEIAFDSKSSRPIKKEEPKEPVKEEGGKDEAGDGSEEKTDESEKKKEEKKKKKKKKKSGGGGMFEDEDE